MGEERTGVADLWEDTFEDTTVDGFIRFLELRMESQYVQGVCSIIYRNSQSNAD